MMLNCWVLLSFTALFLCIMQWHSNLLRCPWLQIPLKLAKRSHNKFQRLAKRENNFITFSFYSFVHLRKCKKKKEKKNKKTNDGDDFVEFRWMSCKYILKKKHTGDTPREAEIFKVFLLCFSSSPSDDSKSQKKLK